MLAGLTLLAHTLNESYVTIVSLTIACTGFKQEMPDCPWYADF